MTATPPQVRRILLVTQAVLLVCVGLCEVVTQGRGPEVYGISYFGVHAPTVALIAVGYGAAAAGLWRTAASLGELGEAPYFVLGVRVVAVSLPLELVTPFDRGAFFNWAHMAVGVVMGLTLMVVGTYLAWRQRRTVSGAVAFLVQLAGGVVAAFSLPDWGFDHMLEGEVLFELGFAGLLVPWTLRAFPRVTSTRSPQLSRFEQRQ